MAAKKQASFYVLATVDEDGKPFVVAETEAGTPRSAVDAVGDRLIEGLTEDVFVAHVTLTHSVKLTKKTTITPLK